MQPILALLILFALAAQGAEPIRADLKNVSINGGVDDGKARLVIEAALNGLSSAHEKVLYSTALEHRVQITREKQSHTFDAKFEILQGTPTELTLPISGMGEIKKVTSDNLQDWSVRQETNGTRTLVLRPKKTEKPATELSARIEAERATAIGAELSPMLTLSSPFPALLHGYLRIDVVPELELQTTNLTGVVPIEPKFLPDSLRADLKDDAPPIAFRFQGAPYALQIATLLSDPDARRVVLQNFSLNGKLSNDTAEFTLNATAHVKDPRGASLNLLSGEVALADLERNPDWRIRYRDGRFVINFDKPGDYPLRIRFSAMVHRSNAWNRINFQVAPALVSPITLDGLAADTQFDFAYASRPERAGSQFKSFLPTGGTVRLAWKEAASEAEGKLFYAAQMQSQISISPGLMRQTAIFEGKVMQGELTRLVLTARGRGSVTAVQGANILSWNLEGATNADERRIVVRFNQPQKDAFTLTVQMQTELAALPHSFDAMQLRPEGATRFAGHLRIVNEGAVRVEVLNASGLSQISPEQFPETDVTKAQIPPTGNQRFVFRFSNADFSLRIQADNVLPELSVSELLAYHLGENELAIDAEFELEIREAPVREILVRIPKGYSIAKLNAAALSDYFVRDVPDQAFAELRLVYSQPINDRQIIQLRLERNAALGAAAWNLPRVEVTKTKSTRGHIAVSADPGFRITPERTSGLSDIATAFFPRKVAGIQSAFRITDANWEATLRVERLPQSIQADALHLFSIGEGVAFGSSTMNFFISGAPISSFLVQLSDEYFNVEFTGKDLRPNWQKTTNGYVVTLNTPVSGAYTLLVTYERPFKAQGDTLTFTGARPMDAQTEQGHTIVVSAYQFRVNPVNVSPGLLALETAEVPAEYRLFFDAPILAAYRYSSRPFNLQLALSPLAQGETVGLVVDRAALTTKISKDGEIVTTAQYFVKNRGNPNFRLKLPADATLWSARVNGATVVPVKDGEDNLIRLQQFPDPNTVQTLEIQIASRSKTSDRITASAPIVTAPVLLAEWKLEPDANQKLIYRSGSLAPEHGLNDASGFAALVRMFCENSGAAFTFAISMGLLLFAIFAWRWASQANGRRIRRVGGALVGLIALLLAALQLIATWDNLDHSVTENPRNLTFLAPVQQPGSALIVEVENISIEKIAAPVLGAIWPIILALLVWGYTFARGGDWMFRFPGILLGWTILAWTALRMPNGLPAFFIVLSLFLLLQIIIPALRRLFISPQTAVAALALFFTWTTSAQTNREPARADSVIQEIRVQDQFAFATTHIKWTAKKDQILPVLYDPAVITQINYPTNALKLTIATAPKRVRELIAQQDGAFDIELQYQLHVIKKDNESGFMLPTEPGLINQVTLQIRDSDFDVTSTNAVSITRTTSTNGAIAKLVLAPAADTWIAWRPRSRDVSREKAEFFAEITHLFTPTAGVIEGAHQVVIRPAQGEINELTFDVPSGATITDVTDGAKLVSLWRFDPDARKLRVTLSAAQSKPFAIYVRSQIATGPLPFEQTIRLLSINGAAGQLGSLGLATGNEVQLDSVTPENLSAINLEDFPNNLVAPGVTVRRAFRYNAANATLAIKASAVEPDVRVETVETLSLAEDRTTLAINASVYITRAGIFRLSFVLPQNLDVETISSPVMSHWTEVKSDEGHIITLHLKGRTEGAQALNISLSGPGTRGQTNLAAPRVVIREANKQRGQLTIVPEQGMRLQVATRDGVTQLDPQKAGVRQKGVLVFRLLQSDWKLTLDLEQVNAWIQALTLQHLTVTEAQIKTAANLQYQIENTGVKSLRVAIPANAESVRFRGDQVADFLQITNAAATNGLQTWEVKLHRRVIGKYLLQATWQTTLAQGATNFTLQGIQTLDANLQRGFVTIQANGRLQTRADNPPAALQPAEWQAIPRALKQDIEAATANYTFRLVEPAFQFPIVLERHDAAKLLPARVNSVTLTSVISDEGVMLTQVKMEMIPGDKRLLQTTLPKEAQFWFAFVNQSAVYPWRENDQILIPLEQQSQANKPTSVEIFYSSKIGAAGHRKLTMALNGPKFDLPLENITWEVYLDDKWKLSKWNGTLQLETESSVAQPVAVDVQSYLSNEMLLNRAKTKDAEQELSAGNSLLQKGDPQQARRALQNAYNLSVHDNAFNEDARVQLHNLKLQQALVGLNVRQSAIGGEAAPAPAQAQVQQLRGRRDAGYTQQEAKQLMDSNTAEDNAALMRLAERLVQQQDAAVAAPAGIRATIPQQGHLLTFKRAVQVNTWADLQLNLQAAAAQPASVPTRLAILASVFALFAILALFANSIKARNTPA